MGHRFSKRSTSLNGAEKARKIKFDATFDNKGLMHDLTSEEINKKQFVKLEKSTVNQPIENTAVSSINQVKTVSENPSILGNTNARQIIIKIQLAKMDTHDQLKTVGITFDDKELEHISQNSLNETGNSNFLIINNANFEQMAQEEFVHKNVELIPGLTLPSNHSYAVNINEYSNVTTTSENKNFSEGSAANGDTLSVSVSKPKEYEHESPDIPEYCEVLETSVAHNKLAASTDVMKCEKNSSEKHGEKGACCHRQKSKTDSYSTVRRCCKCTCRDSFGGIIDTSSKSDRNRNNINSYQCNAVMATSRRIHETAQPHTDTTSISVNSEPCSSSSISTSSNHVSIWAPSNGDVIIPITSPQFVVVQCPPTSVVAVGRIDDNGIRLMATNIAGEKNLNTITVNSTNARSSNTLQTISNAGPIVHSQVDFVHCLVPDLEKIANSSFYWGKMDRYEAERLLDAKPEGTFLLRDSAQEEFLFSVTFRKYGRSLHARIEQSGHQFSFDCHDPCVFTAPTVTGLLEHYKDPSCVMFFEPMLTIPLHRKNPFSLQQLCRATIVSHTTYDGINYMELPMGLKAYLKEYHYKQKLRVKPFDEAFYSRT